MKINVTTQYGIKLLKFLATKDTHTTLKSFTEVTGLSLSLTEQVARKLRVSGLVTVKRGPGGGLTIAQPIETISLLDVEYAVGGKKQERETHEVKFNSYISKLMIAEL